MDSGYFDHRTKRPSAYRQRNRLALFAHDCDPLLGAFKRLHVARLKSALADFNDDFVDLARELERHVVIKVHRRAGILADIETFLEREPDRNSLLESPLRHFPAIHRKRRGAAP